MRRAENGERVVSVSIPIQHVQAVLGVLTLEAGDVDEIIAAQRAALMPFILIAIGVTLSVVAAAQPGWSPSRCCGWRAPPTGCGCRGARAISCPTSPGATTSWAT